MGVWCSNHISVPVSMGGRLSCKRLERLHFLSERRMALLRQQVMWPSSAFAPAPCLHITPMSELNTTLWASGQSYGRTPSSILPHVRVKWLVWSLGVGVQVPVTNTRDCDIRPLFDVVYEHTF